MLPGMPDDVPTDYQAVKYEERFASVSATIAANA